jgi:hypothetical protein
MLPATISATASIVPPRPRRLWHVQDTSLGPIPPYYPPMDPNCTALVTDVPPSLVVVRISECLRKRSIAAEYDEESATARCMTVDRTHFVIQLYRGSPAGGSGSGGDGATLPGMSPSHVVVECQRQSGSATSFHAACHAVLQAAKGLETGEDERRSHFTNGMEFNSLKSRFHHTKRRKLAHQTSAATSPAFGPSSRPPSLNYATSSSFPAAEAALEAARDLIEKDRLECQQLGMERLVSLTTMDISGEETSLYISRRLIQQVDGEDESAASWLIDFLMHPEAEQAMEEAAAASSSSAAAGRKSRGAGKKGANNSDNAATTNASLIRSFLETSAAVTPSPKLARKQSLTSYPSRAMRRSSSEVDDDGMGLRGVATGSLSGRNLSSDELRHDSRLRALALRVLCNALYNLSKAQQLQEALLPEPARASPSSRRKSRNTAPSTSHHRNRSCEEVSPLVRPSFLLSLVQDIQGASRPPSVSETGYRLASVHEAALAIRCLRLLAGASSGDDDSDGSGSNGPLDHEEEDGDEDGLIKLPQARVRAFLRSEAILERLELARSCGRATHSVLQQEAERTYNQLTEDVRSC